MSDSKQCSDAAQKGPGVKRWGAGVQESGAKVPVSYGKSGENADQGNRNKKG